MEHKNLKELNQIAREKNIPNRSRMRRAELIEAVIHSLNLQPEKPKKTKTPTAEKTPKRRRTRTKVAAELQDKNRRELYEMAKSRNIKGRSEMTKDQLLKVLA